MHGMGDVQVGDGWSDERLIAEVEAIAASWHRVLDREQIMLLRGQMLGLVRQYELPLYAELAKLREQGAVGRWEPVDKFQTKWRGTTLTFSWWDKGTSPVIITESDTTHIVLLPSEYRLCRFVPPAGESSHE